MTRQEWTDLLDAVQIRIGSYVMVRTTGQGVAVGRLAGVAGEANVALADAVHVWRWQLTDRTRTGSIYDLLAAIPTPGAIESLRHGPVRPQGIIPGAVHVEEIPETTYQAIRDWS